MQRFLAPLPPVWNVSQLCDLTATRWPSMVGCNVVDDGSPSLAVYLDAEPGDLAAWRTDVAAHVPAVDPAPAPPAPPTDAEIEAARLSLAAATTVSQTKTRALALDDLRAAQIAALPT